jgi:hypothetical protein
MARAGKLISDRIRPGWYVGWNWFGEKPVRAIEE